MTEVVGGEAEVEADAEQKSSLLLVASRIYTQGSQPAWLSEMEPMNWSWAECQNITDRPTPRCVPHISGITCNCLRPPVAWHVRHIRHIFTRCSHLLWAASASVSAPARSFHAASRRSWPAAAVGTTQRATTPFEMAPSNRQQSGTQC